jgi:hypothetical protein
MHQLKTTHIGKKLIPIIKAIITNNINSRPKIKDNRVIKEADRKIAILNKSIEITMLIDEEIKKLKR